MKQPPAGFCRNTNVIPIFQATFNLKVYNNIRLPVIKKTYSK